MIHSSNSKISRRIKCSICRSGIEDIRTMYQSSLKLGIICKTCRTRFSKEDIEMIVNIFFAFGGYFGQFDKSDFSMDEAIFEFAEKLSSGNSTFHAQNVKMWHKVLTYGITPQEFLEELSVLAEQE